MENRNYSVIDYYESGFGEKIFCGTKEECEEFCKDYEIETDGECELDIRKDWD